MALANSTFIDLESGWRLRVVTPVLRSGGYRLQASQPEVSGNTVSILAGSDFLGYEVAYYRVRARGVTFLTAQITRDDQVTRETQPIAPLFDLPRGMRHVRLIYLLRASQTDHDMAVAAAPAMAGLEALTARVLANPAEGCKSSREEVCSWIPAGIAVVPEVWQAAEREWLPAR